MEGWYIGCVPDLLIQLDGIYQNAFYRTQIVLNQSIIQDFC